MSALHEWNWEVADRIYQNYGLLGLLGVVLVLGGFLFAVCYGLSAPPKYPTKAFIPEKCNTCKYERPNQNLDTFVLACSQYRRKLFFQRKRPGCTKKIPKIG